MDGLRQKVEGEGLKDVAYMVVNQQGEPAVRLHTMLAQRLSVNITLYKQDEQQPDVWQALSGGKDDFLVYDRCGRLTHHISLPYSIIGQGSVEGAIKDAYCKRTCGDCVHESTETPEECAEKAVAQPDADAPPAVEEDTGRGHHHHGRGHHGDNHGVHHGRGHHGDTHVVQPQGHDHHRGHGDHDGAGQQGVRHQGHGRDAGQSQGQHHFDLGQMQIAQEAPGAPVMP